MIEITMLKVETSQNGYYGTDYYENKYHNNDHSND